MQEANVSRGSFYTYFPSKLDAFQALTSEMGEQIDQAVTYRADPAHLNPIDDLREANRRYIEVYRENAAFYGLVEQVSTMDAETGSFGRSAASVTSTESPGVYGRGRSGATRIRRSTHEYGCCSGIDDEQPVLLVVLRR